MTEWVRLCTVYLYDVDLVFHKIMEIFYQCWQLVEYHCSQNIMEEWVSHKRLTVAVGSINITLWSSWGSCSWFPKRSAQSNKIGFCMYINFWLNFFSISSCECLFYVFVYNWCYSLKGSNGEKLLDLCYYI